MARKNFLSNLFSAILLPLGDNLYLKISLNWGVLCANQWLVDKRNRP